MTRRLIIFFTVLAVWLTLPAQSSIDDARKLIEGGELEAAITMLEELATSSPKKGEVHLLLSRRR